MWQFISSRAASLLIASEWAVAIASSRLLAISLTYLEKMLAARFYGGVCVLAESQGADVKICLLGRQLVGR
jgi:hypothetical protein